MKKHAYELVISAADHHTNMASAHKDAMDGYDEKENPVEHSFHKAATSSHAAFAKKCIDVAKAIGAANKAAGMGMAADADELEELPRGFSRVTPDIPGHGRLVARVGGPPLQTATPDVPAEFLRAFSMDPDE